MIINNTLPLAVVLSLYLTININKESTVNLFMNHNVNIRLRCLLPHQVIPYRTLFRQS